MIGVLAPHLLDKSTRSLIDTGGNLSADVSAKSISNILPFYLGGEVITKLSFYIPLYYEFVSISKVYKIA